MKIIVLVSLVASAMFLLLPQFDASAEEGKQYEVVIAPNASNPKNLFHFIPSDLKIVVLDTVR